MNFFQKCLVKIVSFFFPSKIYGLENLPEGKAVLVCNHFSFIDPVFLKKICNDKLYILAKKELFKRKLIGKILKSFDGIPIDRDNPGISSVIQVTRAIKDGNKVGIFPEGTRNKAGYGDPLPLKGGTVIFAVKGKCPIVPIVMIKKARLFVRTKILIGKPFSLEEYYDKKLTAEDINELGVNIREKMILLQNELSEIISKKRRKEVKLL